MSSLSQQCTCIQAEQWCSKSLAVNFLYHLGLDISQGAAKWLQGEGIARKITDEVDRVVSKLKKCWRVIRSTSKIKYSFSQHIFPAQSHQEKNLITQFQWWDIIPFTRMSLQATAQDVTVDVQFTSNLLLANQTSSDKSTFQVRSVMTQLQGYLPWVTFLKFAKKAKEGDQIEFARIQKMSSRGMTRPYNR